MKYFECDYHEGAHPRILERLTQTNFEQTLGYGVDSHCENARVLIREACGRPDADVHFLVGGTQTNTTVISACLKPYQGVICASSGHINVHETGAIESTGHKVLALDSTDGKIYAADVRAYIDGHFSDDSFEHMVQPGMVYISHPTENGTLYTKSELTALCELCREKNIPLFVDGARLGYGLMSDASELDLCDIASLCDVFYIGGTKVGAFFGEAVVITNDALKKDFRYMIKQRGGMLAKGRLLGIQFETLFEDGLYLEISRHAIKLAMKIKNALSELGCADNFALLISIFRDSGNQSVLFYWMYAIAFLFNIYFDFSGYSDMAIGLGKVFGFNFIENFNYPYLSKSVAEFWRRWHMSLGSWFRDYVYIPLGGNRVKKPRWVFNTLVVWMLTGMWHGASWNFILWGLLYAVCLLIEKFVPAIQRLPSVLRYFYTMLVVILGFVLFNATDMTQAGNDFSSLFGFGGLPFANAETLYYLRSYAVLFVIGIIGATPLFRDNANRLYNGKKTGSLAAVLEFVMVVLLLLVCTGYLVDGSFSPFLYFRF